jgi:hypothetical protein
MANTDGNSPPEYEVQVFRPQPGSVTALGASDIRAASLPGGTGVPPAQGWSAPWQQTPPIMMPQPSVIVLTMEPKKEVKKDDERKHSEVFKRI